jgi:hypothetical protein
MEVRMKQTEIFESAGVLHKLESIEDELLDIKFSILKNLTPSKKNLISLKGILKGIDISETDIESAKKSL